MISEWSKSHLGVLLLVQCALSGFVPVSPPQHHHHHPATSYMHFHGPVEGPEYEVKVPYVDPHEHHGSGHGHEPVFVHDYVAHPKYQFSYGVEDHHTGDFHSQKESRDGSSVTGEYSVSEPGGRLRIVTYRADKDGFHAVVHTSGKNEHHGTTQSFGYPEAAQASSVSEQQQEALQNTFPATFPEQSGY